MLETANIRPQNINVKAISVPPDHVTDEEILQRIRDGDSDAYGGIMRRYNQRIFRIARSFVTDDAAAMDIVQEAHIKAYSKLDEFRGPSGFAAWLGSIARNESLMYLRKFKKEVVMSDDEIEILKQAENVHQLNSAINLPDTKLENKQLLTLINGQIDQLPVDFRSVFICRAIEQFSVRETAEILDIKEETVKTRYFRAKRLLRGQLQNLLETVGMKVYEFGGFHCDIIVANVLSHIRQGAKNESENR